MRTRPPGPRCFVGFAISSKHETAPPAQIPGSPARAILRLAGAQAGLYQAGLLLVLMRMNQKDHASSSAAAEAISATVRRVVEVHALLARPRSLRDGDDLYRAGMTSHATVSVMLALEEAFEVEFPDEMLNRSTFASIASIRSALGRLGVGGPGTGP